MAWDKLALVEQLGNIGSEITRARVWEEKNSLESRNKALERALDLLDQTVTFCRGRRARELLRLREMMSQVYVGADIFVIKIGDLENFLLPYALASRRER